MRSVGKFLRDVAGPVLIAGWIVCLVHGAISGAVGYRTLETLRTEAAAKSAELAEIRDRRASLERQADLLNPKSLDPDMVDERVRSVLGYAHERDIVLPRAELDRIIKSGQKPLK